MSISPEQPVQEKPPFVIPSMAEVRAIPAVFSAISTFSGGGGNSLGIRLAGGKVLWANEFVPDAQNTYRANHPTTHLDTRDIRLVKPEEILEATGLKKGDIDLFDGSPPCFPTGTLIRTNHRDVPIESLRVGDQVVAHDGRLGTVVDVMHRNVVRGLIKVQCKYRQSPVYATAEHPFYARRVVGHRTENCNKIRLYGDPAWVPSSELQPWDLLLMPACRHGIPIPKLFVSVKRAVAAGQVKRIDRVPVVVPVEDLRFAELLGWWIAEGHVRGKDPTLSIDAPCRREVVFSVACSEAAPLAGVISALGYHPQVDLTHSKGAARVTVTDMHLWKFVQEFGRGAGGKFIPEWSHARGAAWKRALLHGYLEGDGHARGNGSRGRTVKAPSVSLELIRGLERMIPEAFGVIASTRKCADAGTAVIEGRTVNTRDTYQVQFQPDLGERRRPGRVDSDGAWLPVATTEIIPYDGVVHNISVDSQQTYVAEGFAVHNCKSFSTSGSRDSGWGEVKKYSTGGIFQRTDDLFFEFIRLLDGLQPKVFVAENVTGLVKGTARGYFKEILAAMVACGYKVKAASINGAFCRTPQARERIIYMGVRQDLGIEPSYPAPSYGYTALDALHDVVNTSEELAECTYLVPGHFLHKAWHLTTPGDNFIAAAKRMKGKASYFDYRRLGWYKPAPTIKATPGGLYHPDETRSLTIRELKRLSTLPDDFILTGGYNQQWERCGRLVPPLMYKFIADHVRDEILKKVTP